MRLLAGLAKWNILAQLALPGVYVWQTALLTAFYLRPYHSGAYFLFCIASNVAKGSKSCCSPVTSRQ